MSIKTELKQGSAETGLPSYNIPQNTTATANGEAHESGSPYLLSCVDEGSSKIALQQQKLTKIYADGELFYYIQSEYLKLKKHKPWWTVECLATLSLSQFQLDYSKTADIHKHDNTCMPSSTNPFYVCLLPEDIVDKSSQRLTYYFLYPQSINPEQETVFEQLTKRLGHYGPLRASPHDDVIGWGIYFEESYHKRTMFFLCAVLVLFSIIFGVI
ncbi:hypothetical protein CC86DRAFT_411248 [Ophiobolus disseminans]|uniref:Uncharacterized protein n=1 Tax=Ophiobolus disseminans TaxID=1469910 RepID=A0A6A6ZL08_9PLEO|nr:hypothetical protein CC86DRAFT_411248 [Ophiobolus disseminans]